MPTLEVQYHDARLKVEIDDDSARLYINGLLRDEAGASHGTQRLSSTVQTDYEWHEFIEAVVTRGDGVDVSLVANSQELMREHYTKVSS